MYKSNTCIKVHRLSFHRVWPWCWRRWGVLSYLHRSRLPVSAGRMKRCSRHAATSVGHPWSPCFTPAHNTHTHTHVQNTQREKLEAAVAGPGELNTEAVEEFMSISDGQARCKPLCCIRWFHVSAAFPLSFDLLRGCPCQAACLTKPSLKPTQRSWCVRRRLTD